MVDNMRLKRTLEFDVTDAPMLMHAMMIAANTAKLCQHPDAERKLRQYQEMLRSFIPAEAKAFDEEVWGELGMALMNAVRVEITVEPKAWGQHRSWWSEGRLAVHIDTNEYGDDPHLIFYGDGRHDQYIKRGDEAAPRNLAVVLRELAPIDCEVVWFSEPRK